MSDTLYYFNIYSEDFTQKNYERKVIMSEVKLYEKKKGEIKTLDFLSHTILEAYGAIKYQFASKNDFMISLYYRSQLIINSQI